MRLTEGQKIVIIDRAIDKTFDKRIAVTIYTGREYRGEPEKVVLGLHKAKAVDDCIDAIRQFVDKQSKTGTARYE